MSVADPRCERCSRAKVWIGIGPGAVAECVRCDVGVPCPRCGSRATEPFRTYSYWSAYVREDDAKKHHCWPCGHVFTPEIKP